MTGNSSFSIHAHLSISCPPPRNLCLSSATLLLLWCSLQYLPFMSFLPHLGNDYSPQMPRNEGLQEGKHGREVSLHCRWNELLTDGLVSLGVQLQPLWHLRDSRFQKHIHFILLLLIWFFFHDEQPSSLCFQLTLIFFSVSLVTFGVISLSIYPSGIFRKDKFAKSFVAYGCKRDEPFPSSLDPERESSEVRHRFPGQGAPSLGLMGSSMWHWVTA